MGSFEASKLALYLIFMIPLLLLRTGGFSQERRQNRGNNPKAVVVQAEKNQIDTATEVKGRHEKELLNLPGVVGVGVGLSESGDEVAIHVYVDTSTGSPALPLDLEGVPVRVIKLLRPITAE